MNAQANINTQALYFSKHTTTVFASNENTSCLSVSVLAMRQNWSRWSLDILAGTYSRPVGRCRVIHCTHQSFLARWSSVYTALRLHCSCFCTCAHTQSVCLCLQLFKGKFFYCEGLDVSNITNKTQCLQAGHRWTRRKYNFDNLGQVCHRHSNIHTHTSGTDTCCYEPIDSVTDLHASHSSRLWCHCLFCHVKTAGSASCMTAWMLWVLTSRWGDTHTYTHTYSRREWKIEAKNWISRRQTIQPVCIIFHCVLVLFCVSPKHHLIVLVSTRKGKKFQEGREV